MKFEWRIDDRNENLDWNYVEINNIQFLKKYKVPLYFVFKNVLLNQCLLAPLKFKGYSDLHLSSELCVLHVTLAFGLGFVLW